MTDLIRKLALVAVVAAPSILAAESEDGAAGEFEPPSRGEEIPADPQAVPASRDSLKEEPAPVADEQKPGEGKGVGPTEAKPDANVALSDKAGTYVSLEQAIEISILSNLGLRLSRLDDRRSDIAVREAWAQYYPTFRTGVNHSNSRAVGEEAGDGATTVSGGLTQLSPWGTRLDFDVAETRSRLDTDTGTGRLGVSVTQPLWSGAGTDVGLFAIRSARIGRLISRGNLELDVQQLIFRVRSVYANVIRLIQQRDVNRQAVRSDKAFLDLTIARERAGQVTKLDVFNAEVSLRGRELDLISTERALERAYDDLKRLMDVDLAEVIRVDDEVIDFGEKPAEAGTTRELVSDETSGTVRLITYKDGQPVGEPKILFQATRYDEKVVLEEALANRIDLLNSRRNVALSKLQTMLNKDGLGHQIDLSGSFNRTNAGRSVVESDNGGEVNNWTVGINATFPWGKIRDRAAYERALLDLQRAEINLKDARVQVQFDIREIMRALRENEKRLLIEGVRVENAKRSVEAAQSRFDRGLTDSFNVIRAGDDLLRAKTNFVSSKLTYVIALAELELRVGKPTGRVELGGNTVGGLVDASVPGDLSKLPAPQPEADPRPEDHPLSKIREYRKDYRPNRNDPVVLDAIDDAVLKRLPDDTEDKKK
ncbi:MAG TPA: TolC family protein [Planctomycetota bacterium]|nr:TolC family protein [Planctomycetota bacterium]